ncbi:MAG: FMN adenylyltransferase [Clostridiales bacterium]|nr:FMN adenylyltransferase [Clostridiales bacterium]
MSDLFTLHGQVIRGKQLGSKLGFPTANIAYDPSAAAWPQDGVYIGIAAIQGDGRNYVAILNQGHHPTAPGGAPTIEAHMLGYPNHELYSSYIDLVYCEFLRPEQTFDSLDALKDQLALDRKSAIKWAQVHNPKLLFGIDPSLLPIDI